MTARPLAITVPDGYNGATIELDATCVLSRDRTTARLAALGSPYLFGYASLAKYPWLADVPVGKPEHFHGLTLRTE